MTEINICMAMEKHLSYFSHHHVQGQIILNSVHHWRWPLFVDGEKRVVYPIGIHFIVTLGANGSWPNEDKRDEKPKESILLQIAAPVPWRSAICRAREREDFDWRLLIVSCSGGDRRHFETERIRVRHARRFFDRPWSISVVSFMSTLSAHRSVSIKRKAHLHPSLPNIASETEEETEISETKKRRKKKRNIPPVDFLSCRSTDLFQLANTVSKVLLSRPRFNSASSF